MVIKEKVENRGKGLGFFEKYLSIWVILCIVAGVAIGRFFPAFPGALSKLEYAHVSIPVAILIWLMIYPMMLKIDFSSIVNATKKPKGLTVTTVTNWAIKPFTMYLIALFFFKIVFGRFISSSLATEYLAGAVLLGAAPCTAMVFVWSYLSDVDAAYTLV
ncbi:MAG: arsenical-resistance protein, partial [Actinobacteria bacterium]|nr:arsenical-resistance protein [Actinomycetota bacterium]